MDDTELNAFFGDAATGDEDSGDEACTSKPDLHVTCDVRNKKVYWALGGVQNQPFTVIKKAVAENLGVSAKSLRSSDVQQNKDVLIDALTGKGSTQADSTRTVDLMLATMEKLENRQARSKQRAATQKEESKESLDVPPLPDIPEAPKGDLMSPGVFASSPKPKRGRDDDDDVQIIIPKRAKDDPFEKLKSATDSLGDLGVKVSNISVEQIDPTEAKAIPDCGDGPTRKLFVAVSELGTLGFAIKYDISVDFNA